MTQKAYIHSFGHFVPTTFTTSADTEAELRRNNPWLNVPDGFFELMTGIEKRPKAADGLQTSDLAAYAAKETLAKSGTSLGSVDLLIFAAASQDIIEPATANIVQLKLGLTCPAFDIKNACNSFMSGLEVAAAMVNAGAYKNVLVVSGEMPSRVLGYTFKDKADFKQAFASLTLGDAGGAALVSSADASNIKYSNMETYGQHWELATFLGGGSMYPGDQSMMRFQGDGTTLKNSFIALGDGLVLDALKNAGLGYDDIAQVFLHQVAAAFTNETLELIGAPVHKVYRTVAKQGNLAAASLPVAISQALGAGVIKKGDTILVIGLASGISVGVLILEI